MPERHSTRHGAVPNKRARINAATRQRSADDRLVQELLRRPVLLTEALQRDPDLLVRAVAAMPALRRVLCEKLHALEKGGIGRHGHDEVTRMLVKLLDRKLHDEGGWDKDVARHARIAETINGWADIFGPVKPSSIREILTPRRKRTR